MTRARPLGVLTAVLAAGLLSACGPQRIQTRPGRTVVVLLPDPGAGAEIVWGNERKTVSGHSISFVPAGASSVTLLGGEPGIGKSTVLLQAAAEVAASGRTVLYLSGEESPQQIRLRAERLGALHPLLYLASEVALPQVVGAIDHVQPDLVVVDSVQTLVDPDLASAPGSVAQVRE